MRISDWSSDVCSSDLGADPCRWSRQGQVRRCGPGRQGRRAPVEVDRRGEEERSRDAGTDAGDDPDRPGRQGSEPALRSEEHTSELQSLMRISYAVFCLKKKNIKQ